MTTVAPNNLMCVRLLLAGNPGATVKALYRAQTACGRNRLNRHELRIGLRVLCDNGQARCDDMWDGPWWPVGAPDGD